MNKIFPLLCAVLLLTTLSLAQTGIPTFPPEPIKEAFSTVHPNVEVYEWDWKKPEMYYRAKFYVRGEKQYAFFNNEAQWLGSQKEMKRFQVPQRVWDGFDKTKYANWKVDDVYEFMLKDSILYKFEVKYPGQKLWIYLDAKGELVKEEF